jgi:fumarate reductase flavoprotein subunit
MASETDGLQMEAVSTVWLYIVRLRPVQRFIHILHQEKVKMSEAKKSISRREFIKGAAIVTGGGILASCAPQIAATPTGAADAQQPVTTDSTAAPCPPATSAASPTQAAAAAPTTWRTPPAPIDASQIKQTVTADVVVVGAGMSGSCAALAATQAGAKVVILQKAAGPLSNGAGIAAYGSAMQKAMKCDFDVEKAINEWMALGENRGNRKVVQNWIDHSGETVDWLVDLTKDDKSAGPIVAAPNFGQTYEDDWTLAYPTPHLWLGATGMQQVVTDVIAKAVSLGAVVYYKTPGVQLVRADKGRVTGVIGKNDQGEYIQANGTKAVILAAGDYGNNPELRAEFMPHIEGLESAYPVKINTGDGHQMGVWAGAAMQKAPHAGVIHYDPPIAPIKDAPGSGLPWLHVNLNGERFSNEDVAYGDLYAQDMNQPDFTHFQIFDDNFDKDAPHMGKGMMRTEPVGLSREAILAVVKTGAVPTADTLEELAGKIGVPADAFVATVKRYNELVQGGKDLDFGKQAGRLSAIVKPPFYAIKRRPGLLASLGGLKVNEKFQVLDTDGKVIPGLYAAGNNSGDYFGGLEHPMRIPGMSLGRASTTGRMAGINAAAETA